MTTYGLKFRPRRCFGKKHWDWKWKPSATIFQNFWCITRNPWTVGRVILSWYKAWLSTNTSEQSQYNGQEASNQPHSSWHPQRRSVQRKIVQWKLFGWATLAHISTFLSTSAPLVWVKPKSMTTVLIFPCQIRGNMFFWGIISHQFKQIF